MVLVIDIGEVVLALAECLQFGAMVNLIHIDSRMPSFSIRCHHRLHRSGMVVSDGKHQRGVAILPAQKNGFSIL